MFALKSNIFPLFSFFRKAFPDSRKDVVGGLKLSALTIYGILYFFKGGLSFIKRTPLVIKRTLLLFKRSLSFIKGTLSLFKRTLLVNKGVPLMTKRVPLFVYRHPCCSNKLPSFDKLSHLFVWKSMELVHEHSPPLTGYS